MTLLNLQDAMNIFGIVANHVANHFRRVAQGVVLVLLVVLIILALILIILY